MKKNYVLIDYENVQPDTMEALDKDHYNIIVFVGSNQARVTYEVASVLQRMGDRASYVRISGNGGNALDFHIAYYIGLLSVKEPDAYFHIVSMDKGFDPLIEHLKSKQVLVGRSKSVLELPLVKAETSRSTAEKAAAVAAHLERIPKPRTLKTLGSMINALFQKTLTEEDIQRVISELARKGVITVNQSKVSYAGIK